MASAVRVSVKAADQPRSVSVLCTVDARQPMDAFVRSACARLGLMIGSDELVRVHLGHTDTIVMDAQDIREGDLLVLHVDRPPRPTRQVETTDHHRITFRAEVLRAIMIVLIFVMLDCMLRRAWSPSPSAARTNAPGGLSSAERADLIARVCPRGVECTMMEGG